MPTIEFKSGSRQDVGTVYCIGRNYAAHAKELNNPLPSEPMVFLKPASSLVEEGAELELPPQSNDVHHEVEIVVVLNKGGRNLSLAEAKNTISGYAVGIDVTARDLQQKAKAKGHPWSVAKGFATFGPLSRFVEVAEIEDRDAIDVELKINDEIRQKGNSRDMVFTIPALIKHLSSIFDLQPGDLVFTGTPEGVGPILNGDVLSASLGNNLVELKISAKKMK
ncbi:MAG: fumarylacetoacetate hydrolase family protein [Calditrichia bacterium]